MVFILSERLSIIPYCDGSRTMRLVTSLTNMVSWRGTVSAKFYAVIYAILLGSLLPHPCACFPEQGKWTFTIQNQSQDLIGIAKSLAKDSTISIKVKCDAVDKETPMKIRIGFVVRQTQCWKEYMEPDSLLKELLHLFYKCPEISPEGFYYHVRYLKSMEVEVNCGHTIDLAEVKEKFISRKAVAAENSTCVPIAVANGNAYLQPPIPAKSDEASVPDNSQKKPEENPNAVASKVKRDAGGNDPKAKQEDDKNAKEQSASNSDSNNPADKNDGENTHADGDKPPVNENKDETTTIKSQPKSDESEKKILTPDKMNHDHQVQVDQEGVYILVVMLESADSRASFNAKVDIDMKGPHGYLSAADWPLLPFFGTMCGVYVFYAIAWLIVSALQWRDLLRIQFWIGGVIFLGMLEKAVFYAEYQSVNSTGQSVKGAILFAEVLSCLKKTMASMLIIIVSLGFGIVKPRLGPMLHRVVGVGLLYFLLGTIEACLRVLKPHSGKRALMGLLPLAVLESGMCWWVFSSLVQTTRTLRLRRNVVKLTLYRHFTNALIFSVIASVVFMIWSFHSHNVTLCLADWKELWVDIAYWHLLFGVLLLVIMILWRPTNNNQRYAFTPLLDSADDEEEDPVFSNDAFDGMKMRTAENQGKPAPKEKERKLSTEEDDLRWVEENIPSSLAETALPSLMDSEEEILATKFERNKME